MSAHLVFTRRQLAAIDQYAERVIGLPVLVLMENAGSACARFLLEEAEGLRGPVCFCCGRGNNGGDGFVMARHLDAAGVPVNVLMFAEPPTGSAPAIHLHVLRRSGIPVRLLQLPEDLELLREQLRSSVWIVDGLLGTGGSGALRPPYDLVIPEINQSQRPVFSIDLPSGLDCDTGAGEATSVRASLTGSLVGWKPGFSVPSSKQILGKVKILGIGLPQTVLTRAACGEEFGE